MANTPHQFKHREVVRCLKAASAAGMRDPTVHIKLPNGTEYSISGAAASPPSKSGRTEAPKRQRASSRQPAR
jgi:hypothetical protein